MNKKNLLLITDGWVHPPLMARFWLSYALTGPYQYLRVRSLEELVGMDLAPFASLVLYFHHLRQLSVGALAAFETYLAAGGGVLAIHSATASFKDQPAFTAILGGKFRDHGPLEHFTVTPVEPRSQLFKGIPAFTVKDELYLHDLQPDIEPHFSTTYQGQETPMVWTRQHGQGRVCYACPGHRAASLRVPAYRQVLERGLAWAVGDR